MISVILSAYNEPIPIVQKSVDSILGQTYGNVELILINDNPLYSELDSLFCSYKSNDSRVIYIKHPVNKGLVFSLNEGIEHASGEFIARMDADDVSVRDRLENQMDFLISQNYDIVGCFIRKIDEDGREIGELRVPCSFEGVKKYQKYGSCVLHPTWLVRKEVYKVLCGYRNIYACEDFDFILRAIQAGFQIGNLPDFKLLYRVRSTSISNSANIRQKLTMYFLIANGGLKSIVPLPVLNSYLDSQKYQRDYAKLDRYEKAKARISKVGLKTNVFLFFRDILFNVFFYRNIVEKKKLLERGKLNLY